jgi:hypothetical protein
METKDRSISSNETFFLASSFYSLLSPMTKFTTHVLKELDYSPCNCLSARTSSH